MPAGKRHGETEKGITEFVSDLGVGVPFAEPSRSGAGPLKGP